MDKTEAVTLKGKILEKAKEIGFDLCGVSPVAPLEHYPEFLEWIKQGKAGDMDYLIKTPERRENPAVLYPEAKSIISCIVNYYQGNLPEPKDGEGKVSRYALGKDYHKVIKKMLIKLLKYIKSVEPSANGKAYVDTGPIMEKEVAARAGLGWIRKNSLLVNPGFGSYLFIGEILLNISIPPDKPIAERCKDCHLCIDACPTGALNDGRKLDASRCIAYLTIENKGEILEKYKKMMKGWIYGCDICLDVCPWNENPPITKISNFKEKLDLRNISIKRILNLNKEEFDRYFQETPIRRIGLERLKRNAKALMIYRGKRLWAIGK